MIPQHIHDRFFKESFSRLDVIADFVQAYLPIEFSSQLTIDSLVRLHDSHVDDELNQHYVDLLFTVKLGNVPITIALLLEHKSYPEEYPHFQLNRYLLNYWADQLKEKQQLRPIVPIIVYHGQRQWKQRTMRSYFDQTTDLLALFLPDFQYYIINLSDDPSNKFNLLQSAYAKLTAGLLKTIRHKQRLKQMLESLGHEIDQLAHDTLGEQFIKTAYLYIHWASPLTPIELIAIFRTISQQAEKTVMSAAETLIKQGKQEATLQYIRGLLRVGMDAETIASAFDLPVATVKKYIRQIQREQSEK